MKGWAQPVSPQGAVAPLGPLEEVLPGVPPMPEVSPELRVSVRSVLRQPSRTHLRIPSGTTRCAAGH